ncbi:MAG: hypothetical protein PUP92_40340, partial [Rhizonema sp. PD38]|nr:hypothetical protein [Rhizonema sp. PD38]
MTANSTLTVVDIIAIELRNIVQQDVTIPIKGPASGQAALSCCQWYANTVRLRNLLVKAGRGSRG